MEFDNSQKKIPYHVVSNKIFDFWHKMWVEYVCVLHPAISKNRYGNHAREQFNIDYIDSLG